ncbi:hypothetical protein [Lentzea cavernae]|nr:hypothetical protein [Lentzea cavernae]
MKTIDVGDSVHERVALLARVWDVSPSDVIRRLLDEFVRSGGQASREHGDDEVPIHAMYEGQRIDAVYHTRTKRVDSGTGVLAGRSFKSPSDAAMAIVQALNPKVHPNRNGWTFWNITESDKTLATIKPE